MVQRKKKKSNNWAKFDFSVRSELSFAPTDDPMMMLLSNYKLIIAVPALYKTLKTYVYLAPRILYNTHICVTSDRAEIFILFFAFIKSPKMKMKS